MPGHGTHNAVTTVTTVVATPLVCGGLMLAGADAIPSIAAGVFFGVGGWSNYLLTPDLDVDTGCYSWHLMRKFNPAIGKLWEWYWYPYAALFKHRGLSHTPVVGTMSRVIYGIPWLLPLVTVAWLLGFWIGLAFWFAGLAHADIWHWAFDKLDVQVGGAIE